MYKNMRPVIRARGLNIFFNKDLKVFFALLLILIAALVIRLNNLDLIPLRFDENGETVGALERLKNGQSEKFFNIPISIHNGKIPVLFGLFVLIASCFFIDPVLVARIPAVFFGTLTIFSTYLLVARLYNNKIGLLSALFLSFLPWHVVMSGVGIRVVLVPFFGTLIFLFLYTGIKDRKPALFLLSFFTLGLGSLYTYPAAWIFMPIFIIYFFILRAKENWPELKTVFMGILSFLSAILPILVLSTKINFLKSQFYHSVFDGRSFNDLNFYSVFLFLQNFIVNLEVSLYLLFYHGSHPMGQFAPSINPPLLLSEFFFLLFLFSLIRACYKREDSDILMLIWLFLGLILPSLAVKDGIHERFLFVMLPAPIILVSRFLVDLSGYSVNFKTPVLKISAVIISLLIVTYSSAILIAYYKGAPGNKEEWIMSSFGSKEAAKFLFEDNVSKDYRVFSDEEMVIPPYLNYYRTFLNRKNNVFEDVHSHFIKNKLSKHLSAADLISLERKLLAEGDVVYYFLWSPETHDKIKNEDLRIKDEDSRINFKRFYSIFSEVHPEEKPLRKIYYPDGSTAIEVFKILPG